MPRGEGGWIRIQNKSHLDVEIKLKEGRRVDDMGMDKIEGSIAPGEQLPTEGKERFDGGGMYQYIEGDVKFRFQKDGYFTVEAHPADGSAPSTLKLVVDSNSWESKDHTPDVESAVKLVADVDDDDGDWRIELRVFDNYNPCKWMEEMAEHGLGDKQLCRVGIPGTHDSGTYKFDKDKGASPDNDLTSTIEDYLDRGRVLGKLNDWILESIFTRLCQCQDKSFKEQLELGIRYLDLRIAYHEGSGTFMTCHGVYCVDMQEALQEINDFLTENPKEIVILEFKKLYDMDDHHEELVDMVLEVLGDKVADRDECNQKANVQEFWDKGYQTVVFYKHKDSIPKYEGKIWPLRYLWSPWPDCGDADELHEKLKEKVEKRNTNNFFVLQGILTPDTDLIRKQIFDGSGVSIKTVAEKCSGKVVDWVEEEWKPENGINIVIVDFFENCSMIASVINYNRD